MEWGRRPGIEPISLQLPGKGSYKQLVAVITASVVPRILQALINHLENIADGVLARFLDGF